MRFTRRDLLRTGGAAGALLLARPLSATPVLADALRGGPATAERTSPLLGTDQRLVHADLHNHSLLSDGAGDPVVAFETMRSNGLDVAALTDHSTIGEGLPFEVCDWQDDCRKLTGLSEAEWERSGTLADTADAPGSFTAIRGFEWSSPALGHVNVWFSRDWTDPLHTAGATTGEGAGQFAHDELRYDDLALPQELTTLVDRTIARSPTTGTTMRPFHTWLKLAPELGGGADGLAGFNHPGREVGRFGEFEHDPALVDRVVSCEVFNRSDDYLFEGTDSGRTSPIGQCLDTGWRTGLLGVSDEHGTDWGGDPGKGRAGLWVDELSRAGVRRALESRRFFATREPGLRLAAAAASGPNAAGMGGSLAHDSGPVRFAVDVDDGAWDGKPLRIQVLRPGGGLLPAVAHEEEVTVTRQRTTFTFTVPLARDDGDWAVLRVTDPERSADGRATGGYASAGRALAYASPFFLTG